MTSLAPRSDDIDDSSPKRSLIVKDDREEAEKPMSLCRKLCFAVGGVPYQMTSTVIAFFLNIFLLEVAELEPKYVAVVLFAGKAWDAVTDPLCGYFVQRTRSRWGRMRPWIFFSAPFSCAAYFLLFYVPGEYSEEIIEGKPKTNVSMEGKLAYYFTFFCLFEGLLSALHVPYTSLTMYVTPHQKERDSITAYRMFFEAIGILGAVVILGQLIQGNRCAGDSEKNQTVQDMLNQEWSYRIGSFVVIGIYLTCSSTVFFGVKERTYDFGNEEKTGFFAGLKIVCTYPPYLFAAMAFLFQSMAIGMVQGNVALYCTHSLKLGDMFSTFILILLLVTIFAMPLWQYVIVRFGKKTTYIAGMSILVPIFFSLMYLPEKNVPATVVVIVACGCGASVTLLLPWSILPDVLDLFMLEKKIRKDAIFYAFYVFFNKMALGLGLALSQVALAIGDYKTGKCTQPESVGWTLRYLVTPAPVVLILMSLLCVCAYPIDEKRRQKIKNDVILYEEQCRSRLDESQATMSYHSITASSTATAC